MKSRSQIVRTVLFAVAFTVIAGAMTAAFAQQADTPKPAPTQYPPVRVDVTLSRYQGEKKSSSLPFGLIVGLWNNSGTSVTGSASLRMGIDVPVGSSTSNETRNGGNASSSQFPSSSTQTTSTKVEYRSVGTNVDCYVVRVDDTHFRVRVIVNDSSVYGPDGDAKSLKGLDAAAFRTFNAQNELVLRDGQTLLFGTGTDKVSGEVLKVEVTLTVIK
jgi:hypothetical protein